MKRDRRLIAIALVFSLVVVNSCSQLFAMAAAEEVAGRTVVEEAAEEAFGSAGKAAMEGAEQAAMEKALGATFEDIGKLPESAQAALRDELVTSFKSFESAEESFTSKKMPDAFGKARKGFISNIGKIGEQRGFSSFEYDALSKFAPEGQQLKTFPVKTDSEIILDQLNNAEVFEPRELSEQEEKLLQGKRDYTSAKRDVDYAGVRKTRAEADVAAAKEGTPEYQAAQENLRTWQSKLDSAESTLAQKEEAVVSQGQNIEDNLQQQVQTAKKGVIEKTGEVDKQLEKGEGVTEARKDAKDAEDKAEAAEQEAAKQKNQDLATKRKEAFRKRRGSKEEQEAVEAANKELKEAQKKLSDERMKEPVDQAKVDAARKNVEQAQKNVQEARSNLGTSGRLGKAKADVAAAEKEFGKDSLQYKKAQGELEAAQSADNLAQEELDAADKAWREGASSWEAQWTRKVEAGKQLIQDQILMNIVAGFAFMIPNFVIGPIQEALKAKDERETLLLPQNFGDIWMQIPRSLISEPNEPVVAFFLYVGLHEKPTDENVNRDDTDYAEADSYLNIAPLFMGRTEYDDYATVPITDPQFSDQMVNLDTGFQFFGDGKGVPNEQVVPLLVEDKSSLPKGFEESLQGHLDKKAEDIARGVTTEQYFESRDQATGYPGSELIAKRLESIDQSPYEIQFSPIIKKAIQVFNSGTMFGNFNVGAFKALDDAMMKLIAPEGQNPSAPAPHKPYIALRQYVYQTFDTPTIRSLNNIMAQNQEFKELVGKVPEYVVILDADNIMPLQMPEGTGQYNFPSYQINPKAKQILSLFDGTLYKMGGTPSPSGASTLEKMAQKYSQLASVLDNKTDQIRGVNDFINSQLQYGPFVFGGVKLVVDKKLADAKVPVYRVPGFLEDGSDDYVVATIGMNVIELPGSPTNFVSLVTSRIYNSAFTPFDKPHVGRPNLSYTVYKVSDEAQPLVMTGTLQTAINGTPITPITAGLTAPLYSLFMDPAVNPNEIDIKSVPKVEDQQWLKGKLGGIDFPLPVPVPVQWALSDRGPKVQVDDNTIERIGQLVEKNASDLKTSIDKVHNDWLKTYSALGPKEVARLLGIYPWVEKEINPITLRASSAADVKNGNFVYTSPFYPDELLVLANDKQGTQDVGTEYNVAEPQAYAISLTSGKVYGRKEQGELVGTIDNLEQLTKRVTDVQGPFLPALANTLKAAQAVQEVKLEREQYGPDTQFGPFWFYIFKEDLENGQYIYADVTGIPEAEVFKKAKDGKLLDEVKDFYVAIQLKDGITDQPGADNPALKFGNWMFGTKLGAKTFRVLNLVNGVLYDRGGGYQGYIKPFGESVDKNLDIQTGFLDIIFGLLKTTWGKELRSALNAKIQKLTQSTYNTLLAEKKEIADARQKEQSLYEPLDANLKANIDAQQYVEWLQSFSPQRFLKEYKGKYYGVSPDEPRVYIDFNIDTQNPDNNIGMSYTSDGKALLRISGWALDNLRAYNGVLVNADGSQELDVSVDHPSIPTTNMVKLDTKALNKDLVDAQVAFAKVSKAFADAKDKTDPALKKQLLTAAGNVGYAKQAYQSAKVAEAIKQTGLTFFFNRDISAYFVEVGGQRYIDLVAGYEYNTDGTPRLSTLPVYVNKANKDDLLFVGSDQHDLLTVIYEVKDVTGKKEYYKWTLFDAATDKVAPDAFKRYSLANDLGYDLFLYHNQRKGANEYYAYLNTLFDPETIFTGSYVPSETLEYSLLRYFRTRQTDDKKGMFNKSDERKLDPVYIVWDGKPDLKLQKLYYQNELLPLTSAGPDSWSAQYMGTGGQTRAITLAKKVQQHGKTSGHSISITDGKKSYDFFYDTSMLDPTLPVKCVDEAEITRLNFWKQCKWGINVVVDAFGVTRLINTIPALSSLKVPTADLDRVTNQARNRGAIVGNDVKAIRYDADNNRYLYQLTAAKDVQGPYFQQRWEKWHVDLSNGVLYTNDTVSTGEYPIGSMHPAQLFFLLDKLEVSVALVRADDGELQFDLSGNPVMENGKQVRVKSGLVYRSKKVVDAEMKKLAEMAQQQQKR